LKGYQKDLIKNIFLRHNLPILLTAQLVLWVCAMKLIVMYPFDTESGIWKVFLSTLGILYLLLLPIFELIYVISSVIKRSGKKSRPEICLPKTENKDLMGFYKMEYKVPWTVYCTLAGIGIFLPGRKYLMVLLLLLWGLIQILESRNLAKDELLERKKKLREDVLELYRKEKDSALKSLHYGLIMADDSELIPSSFGNGSRLDSNVLLFDKATEIDPFLAEDQEKNFAENWWSLYQLSDFYIYAFDSTKYTMEELEENWVSAVTSCRFPVSKPLYLLIKSGSPAIDTLIRKYAWLPEVSVRCFGSWDLLPIRDIIKDYMDGRTVSPYKDIDMEADYAESIGYPAAKLYSAAVREYMPYAKSSLVSVVINRSSEPIYDYRNYMSPCCSFLRTPLEEIGCKDINYFYHYLNSQTGRLLACFPEEYRSFYIHAHNFYVCGFFPNIFRWNELSIAIMAEFEYANLAMRFVHYYLYCKHEPGPIGEYFKEDKELGEGIWALAEPEDMLYSSLHQKVDISDAFLHNAFFILKDLFGIEYKEEFLDFLHLANILRISRNITRGHGAIRDGMKNQVWFALYVLLNLLNGMLSVAYMEIELKDDFVNVSYTEDTKWYRNGQYAAIRDDTPLLLHGITRKNHYEYINYYKGNAAVPEITVIKSERDGG